tara:strand:+ start:1417 stop:1857 length:441 start_codon:yes stop_codon:yes gene_type:complete
MSALSDELANDPLGRLYSGMTDAEAAISLNFTDRPGPVPAKDVRRYLLLAGKWPGIVDAASTSTTEAVRLAVVNIIDTLANFEDFDLQDATVLAAVTAGLDGLIAVSLMDAAEKTVILAMENNRQSRAQEIGAGRLYWHDVQKARA